MTLSPSGPPKATLPLDRASRCDRTLFATLQEFLDPKGVPRRQSRRWMG